MEILKLAVRVFVVSVLIVTVLAITSHKKQTPYPFKDLTAPVVIVYLKTYNVPQAVNKAEKQVQRFKGYYGLKLESITYYNYDGNKYYSYEFVILYAKGS